MRVSRTIARAQDADDAARAAWHLACDHPFSPAYADAYADAACEAARAWERVSRRFVPWTTVSDGLGGVTAVGHARARAAEAASNAVLRAASVRIEAALTF